jgi:phage N-6-adenine-methyltransferase
MPRRRKYRTNAARQRAYRRRKSAPAYHKSRSANWETPKALFATLDREFHFTLDVCAVADNTKCERYFSPEVNGLTQEWRGICWLNPPYGTTIGDWIRKAYDSALRGATVVCLVPSRTDTRWFHKYVVKSAEIRFLQGRLRFGNASNSAPFPSMLAIFSPLTVHK